MPRKRVDERRQELITAATEVIGELGIQGATTRTIVARAGMSLASFHYAFPSREALFAACIDRLVDREASVFASYRVNQDDPSGAALAALEHVAQLIRENWRVQRAQYELTFHAQQDPDLGATVTRYRCQSEAIIQRLLADLRPTWPSDDPGVRDVVALILLITDGMAAAYIRFQNDDELDRGVRAGAAAIVQAVAALEARFATSP